MPLLHHLASLSPQRSGPSPGKGLDKDNNRGQIRGRIQTSGSDQIAVRIKGQAKAEVQIKSSDQIAVRIKGQARARIQTKDSDQIAVRIKVQAKARVQTKDSDQIAIRTKVQASGKGPCKAEGLIADGTDRLRAGGMREVQVMVRVQGLVPDQEIVQVADPAMALGMVTVHPVRAIVHPMGQDVTARLQVIDEATCSLRVHHHLGTASDRDLRNEQVAARRHCASAWCFSLSSDQNQQAALEAHKASRPDRCKACTISGGCIVAATLSTSPATARFLAEEPMKILLVDDSKSARYALRLQLQRHGVEVDTAESAEAAFAKLEVSLPDAILMDHMMPGLNGFEALDVIRENPRTAAIPVIMCTSHEEPDFVATANKKGVFGILPKSTASELIPEMLEKLRSALSISADADSIATRQTETAGGLSEEALTKLIETSLDARLSKLLPPLMDELGRELTERILSQTQRMLEEHAAVEKNAKRNAAPQPTMADLQAISTRLATETVPDLIKRGIQAERSQITESFEKQLRTALSKVGSGHDAQEASEQIALKAAAMAKRESKATVDAAIARSQQSIQTLELSLRKAKNTLYALIALAAVLGMGAAGVVFYLLGSV